MESLSIAPDRPADGSGPSRVTPTSRPLGTAGVWRQAWTLLALIFATYIIVAFTPMRLLSVAFVDSFGETLNEAGEKAMERLATMVIAIGVGTWTWWQFGRGSRAWQLIRPATTHSHPVEAASQWRSWPLIAVIVNLYGASFFFPICPSFDCLSVEGLSTRATDDLFKEPGRLTINGISVSASDVPRRSQRPILLKGYEVFIPTLKQGCPLWLANRLLWFGCVALMSAQVAFGSVCWPGCCAPAESVEFHRASVGGLAGRAKQCRTFKQWIRPAKNRVQHAPGRILAVAGEPGVPRCRWFLWMVEFPPPESGGGDQDDPARN